MIYVPVLWLTFVHALHCLYYEMNASVMTMRAFIAINGPDEIQHLIQKVRRRFDLHDDAWRWVPPENLHLTLRFLGNVSEDSVQALSKAMDFAVEGQVAFSLSIQGLGCFPHPARPRVLWMDINDPDRILHSIHRRLTESLSRLGFPPPDNQSFRPHLTLARTRKHIDKAALQNLLTTYRTCQFGMLTIAQIHLYRSELHRTGATHTILKSVDL
jgi:2'-5' RNA ligase